MKKLALTAMVFVLMLGGCAARRPTGSMYLDVARNWRGHDIDTFVRMAGPPTSVFRMKDGSVVFTWASYGPVQFSGYSYKGLSSGTAGQSHCIQTIETDQNGYIRRIATDGGDC